ncbi:MAG: hypothetical protein A3H42_05710 [Deltaproteobacteria bacterium RIFCSPLOWO2_02_FULL_46_8]|nr:MAG: hypothetical protein A3H42_05710 [Deltaproteobacteria bacterium RIFCSPLOWO2_02_FULL_46_8]
MISAGYIGGGQTIPTGAPAPVAPTPVVQQPPTVTVGTNGQVAFPMTPVDGNNGAVQGALVNNLNAQTAKMNQPWYRDVNSINGILGLGNQVLQFVDGWWKANIADKLAALQDNYRRDVRAIEESRLSYADKLGNRQLEVTEKLSNNAKEAEETKARNQRLGAEEIARIQEDGKTKRAALGVTDEDFGRRGYSNYGFPV